MYVEDLLRFQTSQVTWEDEKVPPLKNGRRILGEKGLRLLGTRDVKFVKSWAHPNSPAMLFVDPNAPLAPEDILLKYPVLMENWRSVDTIGRSILKLMSDVEELGGGGWRDNQDTKQIVIHPPDASQTLHAVCVESPVEILDPAVGEELKMSNLDQRHAGASPESETSRLHQCSLYAEATFPLLFPAKTRENKQGFQSGEKVDGKSVTLTDYARSVLYDPPYEWTQMPMLFQEWIITTYLNIERVDNIQANQKKSESRWNLSRNALGSRLKMRENRKKCAHVINKHGPPHLFPTLVCNPAWDDLKDVQCALDSVTVERVFQRRLKKFVEEVKKGKVYGEVSYCVVAVEYQLRNLPHAHLLVRLKTPPKSVNDWGDLVKGTLTQADEDLKPLIRGHMLHDCEQGLCVAGYKGRCDKDFPKCICFVDRIQHTGKFESFIPARFSGDDDGLPPHKSHLSKDVDRFVSSYNPNTLRWWQGHSNVVAVISGDCSAYALKNYILKSDDLVKSKNVVDSAQLEDLGSKDYHVNFGYAHYKGKSEHSLAGMKRILSSNACVAKLLNYPSVMGLENIGNFRLFVKPPTVKVEDAEADQGLCPRRWKPHMDIPIELYVYLRRPDNSRLRDLSFLAFLEQVHIKRGGYKKSRYTNKAFQRPDLHPNPVTVHVLFEGDNEEFELYLRRESRDMMLECVGYPDDTFYLRALCERVPTLRDWRREDESWKDAAVRLIPEVFNPDTEEDILGFFNCLLGVETQEVSPWQARLIFVDMAKSLAPDRRDHLKKVYDENKELFLHGVCEETFAVELLDKGLPESFVRSVFGHLDLNMLDVREAAEVKQQTEARVKYAASKRKIDNNPDQKRVLERVVDLVEQNKTGIILVKGKWGRGKTFLGRAIGWFCDSIRRHNVRMGMSGVAAALYDRGMTLHHAIKGRPDLRHFTDDTLEPLLVVSEESEFSDAMLKRAKVLLIDEYFTGQASWLDALDDRCQQACGNVFAYGGKVVMLIGDPAQQLPVLNTNSFYGSHQYVGRRDLFKHGVYNSRIHTRYAGILEVHELTHLERRTETTTTDFEDLVEELSEGIRTYISSDDFETASEEAAAIDVRGNPHSLIAASTHREVRRLNELVTRPMTTAVYRAQDSESQLSEMDILDASDQQIPERDLKLCVGMRLKLLRRVQECPKHTQFTVVSVRRHMIVGRLIPSLESADATADLIYIPRLVFQWVSDFGDQKYRYQFPVVAAYAQTVQSVQGVTCTAVYISSRCSFFSHGSCYTVVGRAQTQDQIKFCIPAGENEEVRLANTVWPEFINGGYEEGPHGEEESEDPLWELLNFEEP